MYLTCKLIAHYFFIVLFISLPISTDLHQFLLNYHRVCLNVWPFNFNNSRFISIFSYRLNTDQPNYLAILTIHSFGYGCILIFALAVFFPAVYDPEQNHIWADLWYSSREPLLYISIYSVFQFPYEQVGCRPLKMTGRSDPRAAWNARLCLIFSAFPQKYSCLCYFSNGKPESSLKFNEWTRHHAYHLELCCSRSVVKRLSSRRGKAYQRAQRCSSPQLISEQTYEIYNSRHEELPSSKLKCNHWTWEVVNSELSLKRRHF